MTSQFDSPDGPYITSIQLIDEDWVEITYQDPVTSAIPKVITGGFVRIARSEVNGPIAEIFTDVGTLLDEAERLKGNTVQPDRIQRSPGG